MSTSPLRDHFGERGRIVAALAVLLYVCAPVVYAQTETQANIIGVVTDESGAVLPGVTVTAASPALQVKEVTAVTDGDGQYRVSGLPLGTYEVTYSLDGFQALKRDGVRLTAGFTARLDTALKLGSLNETITVSGVSPVVDTTSTTAKTSLTRETLELIPTSRNGVQAMLAQAPGVRSNLDVGGNTAGAIPTFRSFGQLAGAWPVVEGVSIAAVASAESQPGVYLDYGGIEEAQVSAVGNDAETPTRGILLSMVVKSGGNTYHGTLMSSYTNPSWVSDNIDAKMAAEGIRGTPIVQRWDAGGDLSGFILKDKLWFYAGLRGRVNNNGVLDCAKPDGSQCETLLTQRFQTIKATYQINNSHRLIGYHQWNLKENTTGATALIDWESRFIQHFTGNVAKGEWQGGFGKRLVANALVGYWDFDSTQLGASTGISSLDIVTLRRWGSSTNTYFTPNNYFYGKYQVKASVNYYAPATRLGDHNLKAGLDFIRGWDRITAPAHDNGSYIVQFSSNVPIYVQVYNFPTVVRNDDRYYGLFIKDQWRLGDRLTLNLGARFAFDQAFVPAQQRQGGEFASIYPTASFPRVDLPAWNTFVPRVHAAYDLSHDGKTVIKGGWGRFAAMRGVDEANYINPMVMSSTTFRWRDLNGNRNYESGETDLNPNGPDYVSQTGFRSGSILNLDERPPITNEFSLSIERQLIPDLAVRATGIYSRDTNVVHEVNPVIPYSAYTIPITNPDPGPDGLVGNSDDPGTSITYWEYPASLRGSAFQASTRVNDPALDRSFTSFEIAVSKRLSNRWQAMGAYSRTRLDVPATTANPNTVLFADNNTVEWTAKASGAYQFPFDILGSMNYELRSGSPWQRTHLFRGGQQIPTIVLPVEPLGAQNYDNLHLLDGRVRKDFRLGTQRLAVGADVFNLLNMNTVISVTTRSGASYGRITTASGNTATLPFLPGRNVQFTLNYSF